MPRKLGITLAFVVLLLVAIEFSYRVYSAGFAITINPFRFNSMNILPRSGLVRLSEHPEVYYELKPDLDTWFQGEPIRTNSYGLPDKEYSLEKPDNTFRVVVIGSSWTMGTGVDQGDTYHSVMEDRLNKAYPDKNFEFISFGVEMYGLRELVGTLKHRALAWDPDLIIVAITSFTAYVDWVEPRADQVLPDQTYPFFMSFAWRQLDRRFGLGTFERGTPGRRVLRDDRRDELVPQIKRAYGELAALAHLKEIPIAIMWLAYGEPGDFEDELIQTAAELDVHYIDAFRALSGTREIIETRMVSRFNPHPNIRGHQNVANKLLTDLAELNLLPAVPNES
ncbi:MAG: SGNH/GDSL hydrolase family protein [Gammaproteobacteria bacterium]|jgi:hypothetical protein|nr:SGNH/GDSL hydrolase family protein [Gammaproteobacteria bacterium]MDP6615835.1 SGNH/GDSL hydrolase family protein [Gammaproteobacteria bacterium]MDP6694347.1 SGNH/GDSL hydrolase family protein [Gammaproteobacteria bacterium]